MDIHASLNTSYTRNLQHHTARELSEIDFPEKERIWGDLIPAVGKSSIIAEAKLGKSFFALQLSISVALGQTFLGLETKKSNVFYINFEITEDMLNQRIQDICFEQGFEIPDNMDTISLPTGLYLDTEDGYANFRSHIYEASQRIGHPGLVIIDPRRNSMKGQETNDDNMLIWTENVQNLISEFNNQILTIHHVGKSTKGAGRGSSVYDGWLDTWCILSDKGFESKIRKVSADFNARDTEKQIMELEFHYPIWKISESEYVNTSTAGMMAEQYILDSLSKGRMELATLKLNAAKSGHSSATTDRRIKQLRERGKIAMSRIPRRQGNHRYVELTNN